MNSVIQVHNSSPQLPFHHPSQKLFHAYDKAGNYIKHLFRYYDEHAKGSFTYVSHKNHTNAFLTQTPHSKSLYKYSLYPKTHLPANLKGQIQLISAYHKFTGPKPKETYTIPPLPCNLRKSAIKEDNPLQEEQSEGMI